MLVARRRDRAHHDQGSTLISVMITMLVLSMLAMVGAAIVTSTTRTVVSTRLSSQARASADAGISAAVAAFKRNGACPATSPSSSNPRYTTTCTLIPSTTPPTVRFTATGKDAAASRQAKVEAVYEYEVPDSGGSAEGAIVSGEAVMNVSSIAISAAAGDGDIILNAGSFDCNNTMTMQGDLIVRNGNVSLNNNCKIRGSVYASGNVSISNAGVEVDGDVVALGNYSQSQALIKGNVFAAGTVTMNSAKVNLAVVSASTADSSFWDAKAGSIAIAGRFSQLGSSTVTGSVSSSKPGVTNEIAPTTTIGGNLTIAGGINTWNGGPSVAGVKTTNASGVVKPAVTAPLQLQPEGFAWIDYDFDKTEWENLGYTVVMSGGNCNYQDNPGLVTAINNLSQKTVLDARSCSSLHLYGVTFKLKTDVVLVARKFESAQGLKINSADGAKHTFHMITPDNTPNLAPTCAADQGQLKIDDVLMGDNISGIAYSPCKIAFGQSGGVSARWNGQIYAGAAGWGGNNVPGMRLDYESVKLPGFVVAGSETGGSTGKLLKNLVRRRDI